MCTNCTGSGSDHCIACKYIKPFEHCVDHCYQMFYQDSNKICQGCHEQCSCSGPTSADCKACKNFKVYWEHTDNQHRVSKGDTVTIYVYIILINVTQVGSQFTIKHTVITYDTCCLANK